MTTRTSSVSRSAHRPHFPSRSTPSSVAVVRQTSGRKKTELGGEMVKGMQGFRVLELAQFTFVPAAGAILADWGADVLKIEHPVRGDTQRGFLNMGGFELNP